ncbi:MAG: hypothetical protein JSU05_14005 [Bacteroidetes bacterium]|nr:hypothetical protein [Bacteroidota bacterium]
MKIIGLMAAVLLIVSCFTPWVIIQSKHITVSGIEAAGTDFGKPGYFHFLMMMLFIPLNFIPKVWAKRLNVFVVALNLAWAVRNYILISSCHAGECPEKQAGLYLVLASSIIILITALFPDVKIADKK